MDTPDLFEDPLSEYCRSPSPAPSASSSVRAGSRIKRRSPQSMTPDFANLRTNQKVSDVIANAFKKTKPKAPPTAKFVKQNIKKWTTDIRRDSIGSNPSPSASCPQHSPITYDPYTRQRSFSSSRNEHESEEISGRNSAGSLSRGLSVDDFQKLDKISNLFEAFRRPVDVAAGRRLDVQKRIKERSTEPVPLSALMDELDADGGVEVPNRVPCFLLTVTS